MDPLVQEDVRHRDGRPRLPGAGRVDRDRAGHVGAVDLDAHDRTVARARDPKIQCVGAGFRHLDGVVDPFAVPQPADVVALDVVVGDLDIDAVGPELTATRVLKGRLGHCCTVI